MMLLASVIGIIASGAGKPRSVVCHCGQFVTLFWATCSLCRFRENNFRKQKVV